MPRLARDAAGQIMAVWLHDDANDTPIFPGDETHSLGADYFYSLWNGANWSPPMVAVANVRTNEPPEFALGNNDGAPVWTEDADGNTATDRDTEVLRRFLERFHMEFANEHRRTK